MNLQTKLRYFYSFISKALKLFSGTLPLTITHATADNAQEYTLTGDSKQAFVTIDGTQYAVPSGYTVLDYIESDGTQYIDTGIVCSDIASFKCKGYMSPSSGFTVFCGARTSAVSSATTNFWFGVDTNATYIRLSTNTFTDVSIPTNSIFSFEYTSPETIVINGTSYTGGGAANTQANTFYIGNMHADSALSGTGTQRHYLWLLYTSSGLVRAFIPMKNSSNVVGMYDLVTNTFFTNSGTGTFTAGTEAPCPERPVDVVSCGDYVGQKNQIVNNGNFASTDSWTVESSRAFSVSNNIATITVTEGAASSSNGIVNSTLVSVTAGHKYLISADVKTDYSGLLKVNGAQDLRIVFSSKSSFTEVADILTCTTTRSEVKINPTLTVSTAGATLQLKNFMIIDLTQMFGTGNEPTTVADAKTKIAEVYGGEQDYYDYDTGSDYYQIPVVVTNNGVSTTTTIYASAPLRKVGTYADVLNSNGTITRNVGVKVLDGTETITPYSSEINYAFAISGFSAVRTATNAVLCSHFQPSNGTTIGGTQDLACFIRGGGHDLFVRYNAYAGNTQGFIDYLAAQYSAGTPVIVYYPLATATTETITAPTIAMAKGTNIITVNTTVVPSNASFKCWTE